VLDIKEVRLEVPRLEKNILVKMFDKKREINKGVKKVYE